MTDLKKLRKETERLLSRPHGLFSDPILYHESDSAAAHIRALQAEVDRREWQPMETAPRDGTHVLVSAGRFVGRYVASYRLPVSGEPQYDNHYKREWRDGNGCWATPTHWMPLPQPPQPGEPE